MSNEIDGYINESFEDLIDRLTYREIMRHIKFIKIELREKGLTNERLTILTKNLTYCYKVLKKRV
ncbi:MAG: hypothetical protein KGD63_05905, partial [Candidatus Lokiarchaeota archaeon]|nr:hypothetical protein [Candidatus Lokiarchaeota archaeon]